MKQLYSRWCCIGLGLSVYCNAMYMGVGSHRAWGTIMMRHKRQKQGKILVQTKLLEKKKKKKVLCCFCCK